MNFDDLPYAFCRHATSKISDYADIYQLHSYGFRGEALASMASISRLSCTSYPNDLNEQAGRIEFEGGEMTGHFALPERRDSGTAIFIRDLFYNTPARLKFIKSKGSEKNSLKRMIEAFILAHPSISFSVKWDDADKEIYPALNREKLSERLQKLFLKKSDPSQFIAFSGDYEGNSVNGYFSLASGRGPSGKHHYLFVNGRTFQDQQLHRTVLRNLEGFWPTLEIGHYVLFLQVPPERIDVNVHPSKTQIKFLDYSLISSLISAALKDALKKASISTTTKPNNSTLSEFQHENISSNSFSHIPISFEHEDDRTLESNFQLATLTEQRTSRLLGNDIIVLNSRFSLLKLQNINEYALIDLRKLVAIYLTDFLRQDDLLEEQISPLLISTPFPAPTSFDQHLSFLLGKGFELDRLGSSTIVLRSLPTELTSFNINPFIQQLIQSLSRLGSDHPEKIEMLERDLFQEENLESTLIDQDQVQMLVAGISLDKLNKSQALINLSHDFLTKLFQNYQEGRIK